MLIEPAEIAHGAVDDFCDTLFHFPRGFVGEGDGENRTAAGIPSEMR
jgi:hypothetical protein